jgi:hypothetical protein
MAAHNDRPSLAKIDEIFAVIGGCWIIDSVDMPKKPHSA